jgi:hypothetical protein
MNDTLEYKDFQLFPMISFDGTRTRFLKINLKKWSPKNPHKNPPFILVFKVFMKNNKKYQVFF